jgi:hypothetical protein
VNDPLSRTVKKPMSVVSGSLVVAEGATTDVEVPVASAATAWMGLVRSIPE